MNITTSLLIGAIRQQATAPTCAPLLKTLDTLEDMAKTDKDISAALDAGVYDFIDRLPCNLLSTYHS